jgi:hypothetical protein
MRLDEKLKLIYEAIAPTITRTEDSWKEYLRFGSAIYKHPFDNALLVYAQNPNATMLATYDVWNNPKVKRFVRRGEKGIAVCDYNDAKLSIKHLFDISQTNGSKVPEVWKLDDELRQGLANRLIYNHDLQTGSLLTCIEQIVGSIIAETIDDYIQGFEGDVQDHFLGDMPKDGLVVELVDMIYNSCVYFVANRCGETADVSMPTISHFDTVQLITRLGNTVTELSKGILLDIERNVKILENERRVRNEQRTYGKQGTPRPLEQSPSGRNDGGRQGSTPREVRQNGVETSVRNQSPKIFTFEDARRAYEPDVQGRRGSDGEGRSDNEEAAGERPDAADRRHHGADTPPKQAQGHSGRNSDTRNGADTEIIEEKKEIEPQGSFSLGDYVYIGYNDDLFMLTHLDEAQPRKSETLNNSTLTGLKAVC